jgi:hypothetical protein
MQKMRQSRMPPIVVYEQLKWSCTARGSSRTGQKCFIQDGDFVEK